MDGDLEIEISAKEHTQTQDYQTQSEEPVQKHNTNRGCSEPIGQPD